MRYEALVKEYFSALEVDCTITVALKILDKKCQMDAHSQACFMALYEAVIPYKSEIFEADIHKLIADSKKEACLQTLDAIHEKRVYAMDIIPKPVMKAFKQRVRILMAEDKQG